MTGYPVSVVTLMPEWVRTVCEHGVIGRAATRALLRLDTVDPREFAPDVHRTVDERPFGGGPGMVGTFAPGRRPFAQPGRLCRVRRSS